MPDLYTLTDIHKLGERYPFSEEELEILIRCHEQLQNKQQEHDFLLTLGLASPYSHFFLPGNEMRNRVEWIEDHVLPAGFSNELRAAISSDAFVEYANQGEDKALERFLEGIADTGRRGTKEALKVLYNLVGGEYAKPQEIMDISLRLAIASDVIMVSNLDKTAVTRQLSRLEPVTEALAASLTCSYEGEDLELKRLIEWAEAYFPLLHTPLATFVHNLIFHGHTYPKGRIPFEKPKLEHASDIFESNESTLLIAMGFMAPDFGGKWHRLYSSEIDGRSFNRLEWSILGYGGPTILVIQTTTGAILGGFSTETWRESKDFYGNHDCFLFQLHPHISVNRPTGKERNFVYMHSDSHHSFMSEPDGAHKEGLGFGGCVESPRLFIPESLENCSANFLDRTFESGNLLPVDSLEKFEIQVLEIWGVGGDQVISEALRNRAEFRERTDTNILKARMIQDKSFLVDDMKSGLIYNTLFEHMEQARGRHEFKVDDVHGGYKVEH